MNAMPKRLCIFALSAWLACLLAGCNFTDFSVESRINAAFPVPQAVELAKQDVIARVAAERKTPMAQEYANKLKLRALTCAKGYAPSWYTTKEEIRRQLTSHSCFVAEDAALTRWLGLIRVGIYLDQPPLAPLPAKAPRYIASDEYVQSARFADAAGIALLEGPKTLQILELASGKQLLQEPRTPSQLGQLSPNGRLFTSGGDNRVRIRSVETGEVIVELASVRANELHWLDHASAIFNNTDSNKPTLLDFDSGSESPLTGIQGPILRVAQVPGSHNQFLLGTYQALAKVELVRSSQGAALNLLDEQPAASNSAASNLAGLNSDGSLYFSAGRELTLTATDTLKQEVIPFQPIYLQSAVATPKPRVLLLAGYQPGSTNWNQRYFLFSLDDRSLTPIIRAQPRSERFIYVASLKKLAVLSDSRIELLDGLEEGEPIALSKLLNDALMEENLRKIEAFEQQQRMLQEQPFIRPGSAPPAMMAQAAPAPGRLSFPAAPYLASGVLAELAKNAQIEAIGVYQGATPGGSVRVTVRPSSRPILLVLSSYEPVRWIVMQEPGARLSALLLSGYNQSQVFGASTVRTVDIGRSYAYQSGTPQYAALDNDVFKSTGKRIGLFQGRYQGSAFGAGGR